MIIFTFFIKIFIYFIKKLKIKIIINIKRKKKTPFVYKN